MSIDGNQPMRSPNGKAILTTLACVLGIVVLIVMYYQIIGF